MQPKNLNYMYTNSKCAIFEPQYSITKIKNNLKCSIQELREEKNERCVHCDLIILLISISLLPVFLSLYILLPYDDH